MVFSTYMNRISILIQQQQRLFHISDLRVLWGIRKSSSLYQTIYRLINKRILFSIYNGFYSIVPIYKLDPIEIGFRAIRKFSYLSTESVLAKNGIINQIPTKITFVSSRSFGVDINDVGYLVRQMSSSRLNNITGIFQNSLGVFEADIERAVVDMLYFVPTYHFDADKIINWDKVAAYQKQLDY